MIIKNASVFQEDGTFKTQDIYIEGDKIAENGSGDVLDADGLIAIPGLTDIHFHGCMRNDFCDGTTEAIQALADYELSVGVTTICPATMTFSEEILSGIMKAAASFENKTGAELVGINMEGPFISPAKKGAQNGIYIHNPDVGMFRRLQEISGGLIKLCDIAPEQEGSKEAYDRGARHATHLYNAMPPFSHRAPGVVGAACDSDHVRVELICDGVHLHPATVRTTFKMFDDDRICLISDSMMATGLSDGDYSLGGQPVKVVGNLATLADGTIAGSATNLMDCMRTAVKKMGIPLGSAVKCAAVNTAKAIGIYDTYGSITPGKKANIVLLDQDLNMKHLIFKGELQK